MNRVVFDNVEKELKKIPYYIVDKLLMWAKAVELQGIRKVRKVPGYHDEPLKGIRSGQRSVRLSKAYRAIYKEETEGVIHLIILLEVNKHEY